MTGRRLPAPARAGILLVCLFLAACQAVPPAPMPVVKPPAAPASPVVTAPTPPTPSTPAPAPAPAEPATALPAPRPGEPFRNVYTQDKDSVPAEKRDVDYHGIPDAVPRREPRGKYGNKSPYTVLGRTYRVMEDARGYSEEGIASWYGNKFHGHRTSSFERYDMYAMTAAHKTLPIPTYVRVTNLDNNRSVIVRVNDRGPFHRGRIIDLSWAAAQKLGYAGAGTARVRVEAIEPPEDAPSEMTVVADTTPPAAVAEPVAGPAPPALPAPGTPTPGHYVQIGAFSFPDAARQFAERARGSIGEPVVVVPGDDLLYRVRVGPYEDRASAERIRDLLLIADLGTPSLVYVPPPAP